MKFPTALFLIFAILLAIGISGCESTATQEVKATLNVKLVQAITPTTFIVVDGVFPLDLGNVNNSWIKEKESISKIKEGDAFIARFDLNYPAGLPVYDNVDLMIETASDKISNIGIISKGYSFKDNEKSELYGKETNVYKYDFGKLRGELRQSIIFGGKTGTIGTALELKEPIYVYLKDSNGNDILKSRVDIGVYRESQ